MKHLFIFTGIAILASCTDSTTKVTKQDGEISSSVAAGSQTEKELKESLDKFMEEEEKRLAEEKSKSTSIEFDKLIHDFGKVKAQTSVSTIFTVTNTGDKPLIIEDVSASCGCTTPIKPEQPIPPGGSDVIEVTFKSKPGQANEIKKTVTVTANTVNKVHLLEIRAFVEE